MRDYLMFRKFLTPIFIELIFWVGVGLCVAEGVAMIATHAGRFGAGIGILNGIFVLLFGPVVLRIVCEVLMAIFGIHDALSRNGKL